MANMVSEGGGDLFRAASSVVAADITGDDDAVVAAAPGLRLVGFSARESAAIAGVATIKIVHGATVAGGSAIIPIELGLNESKSAWFGPDGIACPNGLSIDHVAGTADMTLFYKVV